MSPNPALLQVQRDGSTCRRAPRLGNQAAANEEGLAGLPSGDATKRPASPMGQAGRMAATLRKRGIDGCGFDAPPIGEDEPAMVRRALLIMVYIIARFGEEGNGGASERRGRGS